MKNWRAWIIWLIVGLTIAFFLAPLGERDTRGGFEMQKFGRLPVLLNGRIKPLDTVARNSLLITHGKQTLALADSELTPIDWLAEVMFKPTEADQQKLFVIRNPETLAAIGRNGGTEKYFSFRELVPHLQEIEQQAELAQKVEAQLRSPFQRDIIKLFERLTLYHRLENTLEVAGTKDFKAQVDDLLKNIHPAPIPMNSGITAEALQSLGFLAETGYFFPIPPVPPNDDPLRWRKMGESLLQFITAGNMHPAVSAWATIASSYAANDPATFNRTVDEYSRWLQQHFPGRVRKARVESVFNQLQPFYNAMVIYVLIFILACASWLVWPQTLGRYAFALLVLTFVVHSAGLITRMYLEGRPPVTNLYSSAIFIGWGAVSARDRARALLPQRHRQRDRGRDRFRHADHRASSRAGRRHDGNDARGARHQLLARDARRRRHARLRLAPFVAGFLAIIYIVRGVFTPLARSRRPRKSLARMVYGIVCFATLFSFVGTVLGGIWADQSWGRFWGWDPKENGALIIVLWNALILHARWGGLVRERGLMVMAIFGNIVTSWSWFGVNMLGIGLHSYGFMDSAFPWLIAFGVSQVALHDDRCAAAERLAEPARNGAEAVAAQGWSTIPPESS